MSGMMGIGARARATSARSNTSRASEGRSRQGEKNRPSNASRSSKGTTQSRPSKQSNPSRQSRQSQQSAGSAVGELDASAMKAWALPENEVDKRSLRRVKMIFAGCCLATIASLGLGAAAFTFQTPVRETCIAAGFAILPRVIWTAFCKFLPILSPKPLPAETRIWARAKYKDLEGDAPKFSSFKVIRVKGNTPMLRCLGDVQDIHKGLAAIRIHTNCACCLKEYEPEDWVAVILCGHIYCETCIAEWVSSFKKAGSRCPICSFDFSLENIDPSKIDAE